MMTPEQLQNGKIYKIVCNITNEVYIGSTCDTLEYRERQHHFKTNRAVSKLILKRGNYDIKLIEEYPCETKKELLWRERHYFDTIDCINLVPPIVTAEEAVATRQKYRNEHKEEKAVYSKQYRADNAEQLKINKTKWQQDNKEVIAEKNKIYREKNAEAIKLKKAADFQKLKENLKFITCGCGGTYCDRGTDPKNRHEGTKKHLKWVADSLA